MKIDGREVPAQGTVLDACRSAGADVPALCHGKTTPGGHCRACMVEVDGRWVAACTTPAREGTSARTDTDELRAYRRDLGELMRAESAPGGAVGEVLTGWGVEGDRYAGARHHVTDRTHPILQFDLHKCILCRKCVDACAEVQGKFVLAVEGRGADAHIAWGGGDFAATDCVACGACVQACPTAAITDRDRVRAPTITKIVRTTCGYCGVGCQLDVHVAEDRVGYITGSDAAVNHGHTCVKGRYAHSHTRHGDRLTTPLIRRNGVLEPATWDEAIAAVAEGMSKHRGHAAFLSSSRCSNEENYLVQKWARAGFGTNNIDCCARVCHAPSALGMREVFGTGAATNSLADIDVADLILVVGSNATEAHPVTGARIRQAALRGAKLIVIDPRRTELAAIADVHLQLKPGANVPLLQSIAAVLIREDLVDTEFVAARTEGYGDFATFIRTQTPDVTEAATGVPAELVARAARLFGNSPRPMMIHGLGVTEHLQGSDAVTLLCALAVLRGAIGRPGVGVNPLRGQNNVQGAADMGCQPDSLTGYGKIADPAVQARFADAWGRPVPLAPGLTLPQMLDAALTGEIRAMYILGEDLVQTEPHTAHVTRALGALDFLVVQELFLSKTTELAHVVLPGASALEKDGTFTNGERRIQRIRRAATPPGQARPDFDVVRALMAATGLPGGPATPAEAMDEIARVAPAFAGVHYPRLDGDGLQWPVPTDDHPGTPILHTRTFTSGRARLATPRFTPSPSMSAPLCMITGRVLAHYNAGSMTRRAPNVAIHPADLLEINPADAKPRGITDGARVEVRGAHGVAHAIADVTDRVKPGVAFLTFHFPETEANAVTTDVRDRSGCPEYKLTPIDVVLASGPPA